MKCQLITPLGKDYPDNLSSITKPPALLYVKGALIPLDKNAVGIIGTRNPSEYGKRVARLFTSELSSAGITIVSGLARGIDTIVHTEALRSGGRTIAVMGSGINRIYPMENKALAEKIMKSGALVSEFPDEVAPLPKHFLLRNRIISGLSLAIIVVEGRKRSGTLSTANHAANQSRDVFAVPGEITNPMSGAPNYLISQGATIALSPDDVLTQLLHYSLVNTHQ